MASTMASPQENSSGTTPTALYVDSTNAATEATLIEESTADSYIQTTTSNWVSRQAVLENGRHVDLKGRCIVHDFAVLKAGSNSTASSATAPAAWIRTGRYCHVGRNTTIETATLLNTNVPVTTIIGSHTMIGPDCKLQAAAIGSFCCIGNHVTAGPRCIVKDCCVIADGVVIPADTVIPPFTHVSFVVAAAEGSFQRLIFRELPPATAVEMQERSMELYQDFVTRQFDRKG